MNYDVMQPNNVLRACAREQLHGIWKKMAFIFLVYFLILLPIYIFSVLSEIYKESLLISFLNNFFSIVYFVVSGPFALGLASLFLKRIRGDDFSVKNIFDGFKNFGKSFLLMLLMGIFIFLWSLLLIIPGIIKGLSYSMAFFILHDNPDIKLRQALKESAKLTNGYKGKLFGLYFSFIGWALLGILTLGIGYLWFWPYMYMSFTLFYENLKISNVQKNGDSIK